MTHWWVEEGVFDNEEAVKTAITQADHELIKGKPTRISGETSYSFLEQSLNVVFYGSINTVKDIQRKKIPIWIWCKFNDLRCSNYYAYWGQYLVQKRYGFYPLAEIKRNKDLLFSIYSRDNRVFIRPDDNAKSFHGGLVEFDRFDRWWDQAQFYGPERNCLCVVSSPENIRKEFRFIICGSKVVTGSTYEPLGEFTPGYPDEAKEFAEKVASLWRPDDIYCLDVALVGDEYSILEIGSVNCCGLYGCELDKVVNAVDSLITEFRCL